VIRTKQELSSVLEGFVNAWCDRRCLSALRALLQGYPLISPLTDSWAQLLIALENVRAFARNETSEEEKRLLDECILVVNKVVHRE
jgi:hypothetical protein